MVIDPSTENFCSKSFNIWVLWQRNRLLNDVRRIRFAAVKKTYAIQCVLCELKLNHYLQCNVILISTKSWFSTQAGWFTGKVDENYWKGQARKTWYDMIFYICYYYWFDSEGIIGSGQICHSFANLVLLLINNNMLMIDTLSMKSHSWRLFINNVGISLVNRNWLDIILDQSLWRKLQISYKNIVKGYNINSGSIFFCFLK